METKALGSFPAVAKARGDRSLLFASLSSEESILETCKAALAGLDQSSRGDRLVFLARCF
jgi:hypothetical protein